MNRFKLRIMSEIVPILVSGVVGVLGGSVGSYVMFKIVKSSMKTEIEQWVNSEKGREAIYSIGILLGNAIATGSGLNRLTKTQGGLKGMVMQGIAQFIQSKINPQVGEQPQT